MNKLMKRAAAALLSLAMLGGLPFTAQYGGLLSSETALTAEAAELCTIKFEPGRSGNHYGGMESITVLKDSNYMLPECGYDFDGFVFDKWDYGAPGTIITVSYDITIHALWKKASQIYFSGFYPAEGGSGNMPSVKIAQGSYFTLPECGFKLDGYYFDGWDLGKPGKSVFVNQESLTLRAQWKKIAPVISFDANGGDGNMPAVTLSDYQDTYTLPSCNFERYYYYFDKWDLGMPGETISVSGDTTLKAIWKQSTVVKLDQEQGITLPIGQTTYTLPSHKKYSTDYSVFTGWKYKGEVYQPGDTITVSPGFNNVTSEWAAPYTIFCYESPVILQPTSVSALNGKVFAGYRWINGDGTIFQPGNQFPPQSWIDNESITYQYRDFYFEILWEEPKTLNVYFEAGEGGQGSMPPVTVQNAVTYTIPECTFTAPAGKKFGCWYAEDYDGNQYLHPGDAIPAEKSSYNLIAIWVDKAPTDDVQISHNVALNNNFSIAYYIPTATFQDCTDVRLSVKKEVYTDAGVTYEETVLTDPVVQDSGYGEEFIFEYSDIAAKEIGSNLTAVIEADMDGETYYSEPDVYSVKQYATNKLKNSSDASLKKLLVDMLNYGAAAQTYFNYNTDNLANNKLTLAQKKLATDPSTLSITSDASETAISSPKAQFTGKNLLLGNNVALVFYMTFDSSVNKNNVKLELTYTTVKGEAVKKTVPFSQMKASGYAAGEYEYDFLDIRAKDSCQPVTARILLNGNQISSKITYSVQTYAYNKLNKSTTSAELKTIINALMVYCKSAENYFSA